MSFGQNQQIDKITAELPIGPAPVPFIFPPAAALAGVSLRDFQDGSKQVDEVYPLWDHWARRYGVRSVIVEAKNEKKKASFEDISQMEGYFGRTKLGRLGFLVARMGFTANARRALSGMARDGDKLIIPFDEHGLKELARASKVGAKASMEYLRRQETLLLQDS